MLLAQTFFFLGVSLIFINPGLVPQPEPYFDLTPIRVTHTKIDCKNIQSLLIKGKIHKKPNLLHILLSAPDEWLVPS